jgi:hypothetical protein
LHLHAALVPEHLVPFVDDDQAHALERAARIGPRQQQRQALGRGDERGRQTPRLCRAFRGAGIATAHADRPVDAQVRERRLQGARRIRDERAHRRDPQHRQRRRRRPPALPGVGQLQRAEPESISLAGAGGGVQQAVLAAADGAPGLALELERRPAARREPAFECRRRQGSAIACHRLHA